MLGAVVESPGSGGISVVGRLSLATHSWLGDHVVSGRVVVPGAALVEMASFVGGLTGCGRREELLIDAPMVLVDEGGLRIQVSATGADEHGRREVTIHTRPDDDSDDVEEADAWTRHASGVLVRVKGQCARRSVKKFRNSSLASVGSQIINGFPCQRNQSSV